MHLIHACGEWNRSEKLLLPLNKNIDDRLVPFWADAAFSSSFIIFSQARIYRLHFGLPR
jgi:hypothetical protein